MAVVRTVARTFAPNTQSEGVGAKVRRCIGGAQTYLDPFLMCDDFEVEAPAGFPDHPHRGFETVTYLLEGSIAHEDFAGHKGLIGPGDIQWMTAGRGIVHAEMPASRTRARGLQLWLNLKSDQKMIDPAYQDLRDADMPRAEPKEGVSVKVIAGEQFGAKSSVFTRTPSMMLDVRVAAGKEVELTLPGSFRAFAYVLSGSGVFGGNKVKGEQKHALYLDDNRGETLPVKADGGDEELRFMLFAGEPINEPVIQYGPFVVNTDSEMYNTLMDFENRQNGFERAKKWRSSIADGAF